MYSLAFSGASQDEQLGLNWILRQQGYRRNSATKTFRDMLRPYYLAPTAQGSTTTADRICGQPAPAYPHGPAGAYFDMAAREWASPVVVAGGQNKWKRWAWLCSCCGAVSMPTVFRVELTWLEAGPAQLYGNLARGPSLPADGAAALDWILDFLDEREVFDGASSMLSSTLFVVADALRRIRLACRRDHRRDADATT